MDFLFEIERLYFCRPERHLTALPRELVATGIQVIIFIARNRLNILGIRVERR